MDLNDARLYFKDPEDFVNEYEDLFFEAKQFFCTRPVIPSVFRSKLEKLKRQYEAYCVLKDQEVESFADADNLYSEKELSGSIREVLSTFNRDRSTLKQSIVAASSFKDLHCAVIRYLRLYAVYASLWPLDIEKGDVKIGVETDSMALIKGVDDAEKVGVVAFDQLERLSEDHPLRLEAKRLTLWRNKFEDGI